MSESMQDAALDKWRLSMTKWQRETNDRLDQSNTRLDDLDRGQVHIIKRLDAQDVERSELRVEIEKNTKTTQQTLDQTTTIRELAENMQAAGRFFNSIYGGATWCVRKTSACAKVIIPIITAALLIWGALYAYVNGGKPPSVGEAILPIVPNAVASEPGRE